MQQCHKLPKPQGIAVPYGFFYSAQMEGDVENDICQKR